MHDWAVHIAALLSCKDFGISDEARAGYRKYRVLVAILDTATTLGGQENPEKTAKLKEYLKLANKANGSKLKLMV